MYVVYIAHNLINNKVYIGKAKDLTSRRTEHFSQARGGSSHLPFHRALLKYGENNFEFSVIQSFEDEFMCLEAEKYWIKFFNSRDREYGYNITEGGEGVSGWHPSLETKRKMSDSQLGKIRSEEHRQNIRLARLGTKHSGKTLDKMSGSNSIHAKLTEHEVLTIVDLYALGMYSHRKLASMFNISKTQITNILNRKQWVNLLKDK